MKIVFMGSASFAVPSLKAILDSRHKVIEVVTQPDKPAGRGRHITPCPVAVFAKENGLKLFQPQGVKKPEAMEHFKALKADLIVVVAYGKLLPRELFEAPKFGAINVHASLLPKYRGAAPINWAIANGETETGVTVQRITEELDAGDIILACRTSIDEVETASSLYDRLSLMGAEVLLHAIDDIEAGRAKTVRQDPKMATFAPILKKEDGMVDWSKKAAELHNMVRGFTPWPGVFTHFDGKLLRVHEAAVTDECASAPPGTVVRNDGQLAVTCGKGVLYLLEVQIEGKKRMSAPDFLRGHKIAVGTKLK